MNKFKPGDKATVNQSNKVAEILAGPVNDCYWVLGSDGNPTTFNEQYLHPVPRITFTEKHFDAVKAALNESSNIANWPVGEIIRILRRDHSEPEKGE